MTDLAVPDLAGSDAAPQAAQSARSAELSDYLALMKPRVMSLSVFTALVGMVIAPDTIHPAIALTALIAISVGAGASGALNMWYDADIDRLMQRTAKRPIPRGRLSPSDALAFGVILAAFSVITLGLLVNWLAGGLLALTIGFYLFIYTMWLKRRTPQNIVIGGAAGAFPPMIGWAAATGSLAIEPIVLFLIIFLWTPPHFWALALYRARDYERAGIPMLPVVAGRAETKWQILIYSLVLVPVGIAPVGMGFGGWLYSGVSVGLGAIFLALAVRLYRSAGDPADAETIAAEDRLARQLFAFSILYLFLIFASLLAEHGLGVRLF